jgi:hypothetical protein
MMERLWHVKDHALRALFHNDHWTLPIIMFFGLTTCETQDEMRYLID